LQAIAGRLGLEAMKRLVSDPNVDLMAKLHHGTSQTVLREALLVADHNAYHLGQLGRPSEIGRTSRSIIAPLRP
jgi:hypothetical protein